MFRSSLVVSGGQARCYVRQSFDREIASRLHKYFGV